MSAICRQAVLRLRSVFCGETRLLSILLLCCLLKIVFNCSFCFENILRAGPSYGFRFIEEVLSSLSYEWHTLDKSTMQTKNPNNDLTPTQLSRSILFTGGGSAGHVTPNLALIKRFQEAGWDIKYIGSTQGIEKDIISRTHLPYFSITTAKLRRHLSAENLLAPFKVLWGIAEAFLLCHRMKPQIVFSKGGFVAFPVVLGAWLNRIPVVAHESDLTPGLANRMSFPFVKRICVTFPEGKTCFKDEQKIVVTGTPIRQELLQGDANKGRHFCGFDNNKPILLVIGGGLGSENVNQAIRNILPQLLQQYQIVHLCGKGKTDSSFNQQVGYKQFEYLNEELADVFAAAQCVVSRAGANAIYELLALAKPHVLIPLSKKASRGDQLVNAAYFAKLGISTVIYEEQITENNKLLTAINSVFEQQETIKNRIKQLALPNSTELIYSLLVEQATQ